MCALSRKPVGFEEVEAISTRCPTVAPEGCSRTAAARSPGPSRGGIVEPTVPPRPELRDRAAELLLRIAAAIYLGGFFLAVEAALLKLMY